jgi:hypothetical protein
MNGLEISMMNISIDSDDMERYVDNWEKNLYRLYQEQVKDIMKNVPVRLIISNDDAEYTRILINSNGNIISGSDDAGYHWWETLQQFMVRMEQQRTNELIQIQPQVKLLSDLKNKISTVKNTEKLLYM